MAWDCSQRHFTTRLSSSFDFAHEFVLPEVVFVPSDVGFLLFDGHVGIPAEAVDDEIDEVAGGARLREVTRQPIQKHVLRKGHVGFRPNVLTMGKGKEENSGKKKRNEEKDKKEEKREAR